MRAFDFNSHKIDINQKQNECQENKIRVGNFVAPSQKRIFFLFVNPYRLDLKFKKLPDFVKMKSRCNILSRQLNLFQKVFTRFPLNAYGAHIILHSNKFNASISTFPPTDVPRHFIPYLLAAFFDTNLKSKIYIRNRAN